MARMPRPIGRSSRLAADAGRTLQLLKCRRRSFAPPAPPSASLFAAVAAAAVRRKLGVMERVPEPELMTGAEQVAAYAGADFTQPHQRFIQLLQERLPQLPASGTALDLGCGPGDIACRYARAFPGWQVHGLDGSLPMVQTGQQLVAAAGLTQRITLCQCHLPDGAAPLPSYDLVYSNSVLHHLAEPGVLWACVQRWCRAGGPVFVMDLRRPDTEQELQHLVHEYSRDDPEVLRSDFRNSLRAAYRAEEVREQLARAGLQRLRVEVASDRHWLVWG
jgi:ubiquinone/menaquinone biosynthesis C-methylase UbiE